MTLLPSLIIPVSTSQRNLLVAGSIPVVGSSRRSIGGLPTKDTAVLSFLLLPPLEIKENKAIASDSPFLLHFLMHIHVLMLCRKFELIPIKFGFITNFLSCSKIG